MPQHFKTSMYISSTPSVNNSENSDWKKSVHYSYVVVFIEDDVEVLIRADRLNDPDKWTNEEVNSSPSHTTTPSSCSYEDDGVDVILELDMADGDHYESQSKGLFHAHSIYLKYNGDEAPNLYFEVQQANKDSYYDADDE